MDPDTTEFHMRYLEARVQALEIDLRGAQNITANQTRIIERLQAENRGLKSGRGGWGDRT